MVLMKIPFFLLDLIVEWEGGTKKKETLRIVQSDMAALTLFCP